MKFPSKSLCCTLFFMIIIGCIRTSACQFEMWMDDLRQESESAFAFDIYLKNTCSSAFVIESYSFGIQYNLALLNGGACNHSFLTYVEGSSGFAQGDDRPNYPGSMGFSEPEPGSGVLIYQAHSAHLHAYLTPLAAGEQIKIGRFRVQLRDTGEPDSKPHPLGCVFPDLSLREELCRVFTSDNHTGPPHYQLTLAGGTEIPDKVVHQPAHQQPFAGYWFYGTGSWNDAGAWNTELKSEYPDYVQTPPGSTANVVVAGQLHIPTGTHADLTHNNPHSGHLSLIPAPEKSYSISLVANGDNILVSLYDEYYQELGEQLTGVTAGTNFYIFTIDLSGSDTFINWMDQEGTIISNETFFGPFTMPSHDVVLTANWASGHTPGGLKAGPDKSEAPSLTIGPGASLRINTLQVDMPDSDRVPYIHIMSDGQGSGALLHGSSEAAARVDLYMPGDAQAWHLLSAPVGDMDISGSAFAPGGEDDFYLWDEGGTWINFKNPGSGDGLSGFEAHNTGSAFKPGKGYLVAYNSINPAKSFAGRLHAGTYTATLSKSPEKVWKYESGWNLLGNPYASSIDFSAIDTYGVLAEDHAHVYNPNKPGGEGYESVTVIAPGQGFFVRAAHHGAEFVFSPASQVYGGAFLKNMLQPASDTLLLRLSQGDHYDQLTIVLNEKARHTHNRHNASKLYSFDPGIPQIAGMTTDKKAVSIHHIPYIQKNMCIPLLTRITKDCDIGFSVRKQTGSLAHWNIALHDTHTGTYHPIDSETSLLTTAPARQQASRYQLCFLETTVTAPEHDEDLQARIFSDGKSVIVDNPYERAHVRLYKACGALIRQYQIGRGAQKLHAAGHKGPVLAEVTAGESRVSSVVVLH